MTDLTDVRPACTIDGEPWYDFLFEYDWDGAAYGFEICARSEEEARARLRFLPLARYMGPGERIDLPAVPFARMWAPWWLTLKCTWRNLRQRRKAV